MVVFIILCIVILLVVCGYVLFTQQKCWIQHTLPVNQDTSSLPLDLTQLANWLNWLPWIRYDTKADVMVKKADSGHPHGQITLSSQHLGTITCTPRQPLNQLPQSLLVTSDRLFYGDLHITIDLIDSEEGKRLRLKANNRLPFWRRYHHTQQLNQLYADLKLMLVQLHSTFEPSQNTTLSFTALDCQTLSNMDAVTRPFIVSDQHMSQTMAMGFQDLTAILGPENPPAGPRFALYDTADLSHHYFVGRLGIPIQCFTPCEAHPERLVFKGQYARLKYQGSYEYLGLAWHVLKMQCLSRGLKKHPRRPSLEVFDVSPHDTNEELQFITVLNTPIH